MCDFIIQWAFWRDLWEVCALGDYFSLKISKFNKFEFSESPRFKNQAAQVFSGKYSAFLVQDLSNKKFKREFA